jgi:NADH-quinone oxidoreductase subunit A
MKRIPHLLKKLGKVGAVSQPRAAARSRKRGYNAAIPRMVQRHRTPAIARRSTLIGLILLASPALGACARAPDTPDSSAGPALWPLAIYSATVVIIVAGMLGLSYVLGEKHRQRTTGEPYESGMPTTGSARLRFDVKFYLVATFFVVFDLEAVFLFAWAVAARELGWAGYIEVAVFIGVLLAALVYLWGIGALDWGSKPRKLVHSKEEADDVETA